MVRKIYHLLFPTSSTEKVARRNLVLRESRVIFIISKTSLSNMSSFSSILTKVFILGVCSQAVFSLYSVPAKKLNELSNEEFQKIFKASIDKYSLPSLNSIFNDVHLVATNELGDLNGKVSEEDVVTEVFVPLKTTTTRAEISKDLIKEAIHSASKYVNALEKRLKHRFGKPTKFTAQMTLAKVLKKLILTPPPATRSTTITTATSPATTTIPHSIVSSANCSTLNSIECAETKSTIGVTKAENVEKSTEARKGEFSLSFIWNCFGFC